MSMRSTSRKKIAVIGGGWYGSHIAKVLGDKNEYDITLFEKSATIFSGISGKFGIRIHAGPHYPRSPMTRKTCRDGFDKFCESYPELVNELQHSIYAIGQKDVDGNPSKVSTQQFRKVCREFRFRSEVDCNDYGYDTNEVLAAFNVEEPCAILGERLRTIFEKYLKKANVTTKCNFDVTILEKTDNGIMVGNDHSQELFEHVINATSYQELLPKKGLPLNIKTVYQICLGVVYEDQCPSEKPISFIVMDGWFPCLMPYDDRNDSEAKQPLKKYVITHGKWTILASYDDIREAQDVFNNIDDAFIVKHVKEPTELYIKKSWPGFGKRFQYKSWVGSVLAKMTTNTEFRGAITFQDQSTNVIYVFPGKITNIFDAEQEVLSIIKQKDIIKTEGFNYVKNGVLDKGANELTQKTEKMDNLTCKLQTFKEELDGLIQEKMDFKNTEKNHQNDCLV